MGVHGLWRLIEPSGRTVPLETLENKVLAVDVSIWLHQAVKGFQDNKGAPIPNAHLLGLYHRICKLLYFRIKPVFVFDGGVPVLKKQTIAKRHQLKAKNLTEADRVHKNLLATLLKHSAISKVLSEKTKAVIASPPKASTAAAGTEDNLYYLPPSALDSTLSSSEDETTTDDSSPTKTWDLHSIDTKSVEFKTLPVDVRHEILTDLKETRKQSSWGRINELPTESDDFSIYQMNRLLKRQSVQSALEEAEKEMGGVSLSLGELETLLKDQGVITSNNAIGKRIASDENTRFLLIKDVKKAIEEAKEKNLAEIIEEGSEDEEIGGNENGENNVVSEQLQPEIDDLEQLNGKVEKNRGSLEFESDLERAIALSLRDEPSTSKENFDDGQANLNKAEKLQFSFLGDADFESESSEEETVQVVEKFTSAQRYMMEYSGLTPSEIDKIIASKSRNSKQVKAKEADVKKTGSLVSATVKIREAVVEAEEKKEVINRDLNFEISDNKDKGRDFQEKQDQEEEDEVELMSGSDSNSDDFLEVTDGSLKKVEETMEVVIKPVEQLEDDLFGDIFGNNPETHKESPQVFIETPQVVEHEESIPEEAEKPVETSIEEVNDKEVREAANLDKERKATGASLKEKIDGMLQHLKPKEPTSNIKEPILSVKQMGEMRENLIKDQVELAAEKSRKERLATNITDQMYQETQELLELFGVPYITAPMEAEAQCAFLDEIELTDGTITDDSDIWLFGGRTVYKNFFNHNRQVLEFRSENIQHCFKLTREQMILLALLVGSDYTVGLTGVGPVTALEILAAFPPKINVTHNEILSGLAEFRAWVSKGKLPGPGRTSLRSKLKNLVLNEGFPSFQVAQAYLQPRVETSKEKFSWAKPDIVGLTDFAYRKFGWSKTKSDEILKPVVKRMEEKRIQTTLRDYFKTQFRIEGVDAQSKMSKRVKTALSRIGKNPAESEEEAPPKKRKKPEIGEKSKRDTKKDSGEKDAKKKRNAGKTCEERVSETCEELDEDVKVLKEVEAKSSRRVEEIEMEAKNELRQVERVKRVPLDLHKKETIPQKLREKSEMLRNKMKAIEVFRKSKQGPGFVNKKKAARRAPKEEAALSESSSDE